MMRDYLMGNWRNNALADMYRQPHQTMDIEQRGDGFGNVGGGLGGNRNQFQQSQFQAPLQSSQPQWQGVDQTQWQPQYAQPQQNYIQPPASPYSQQGYQGDSGQQSSYGQAQQMTPNPLARFAGSAYTSNGWGWNG